MKIRTALGTILFAAVAGCATTSPPRELLEARSAYTRASQGVAAQYNPADLHTAQRTLAEAERSFRDNGDTPETRDVAYIAERRSEMAESRARAAQATKQRDQAVTQMRAAQAQQLRVTSAELNKTQEQLQREQTRRAEAEKRANQAAQDLARIATVKQDPRGMVITLSGSVLFASGKSALLPAAQAKLSDVANALTKQDPDSKIVVEGFTDSQGSETFNQELSQKRAEAVRDYLVGHGIAADRVTAQGYGPAQPVADNKSAEGRANNRRVEIIVQPLTSP